LPLLASNRHQTLHSAKFEEVRNFCFLRKAKSKNVVVGEKTAKPSLSVEVGDIVHVRKEGFNMTFKVLKLLEKRVGAPIAVTCYENLTPEEEMNKYKDWFVGKAQPERRDKGAGRPTKRERRELDEFKDGYF